MRFPGIDRLTITASSDQMVDIYCSILIQFSNGKNKITQYLGKNVRNFSKYYINHQKIASKMANFRQI